ncbi:MAG: Rrf2 family transcriptional regulator [Chloroflexi bacterium]|nr:Rrf2 family transcriptional regulator [Chloroflexota bacterium]
MQITRQADYALRAMLYLAELDPNQRAATSQIAEDQHIPPSFLAKIISQLSIAGLIHTSRGARGGVSLARSASEISILEVVEAIDGPISLNECTEDPSACTFSEDCPLRDIWCDAQAELVKRLKKTSFSQFITKRESLNAETQLEVA